MEIRLCTELLWAAREQVSTSWLASKRGEKPTVRHACGILVWNPERLKSTTDRRPKNKVKSQWRRLDLIARLSGHRNTIHPAGSQLAAMTHHCQCLSQHALRGAVLCSLSFSEAFPGEVCACECVSVWKLLSCLSLSLLHTDSRVQILTALCQRLRGTNNFRSDNN